MQNVRFDKICCTKSLECERSKCFCTKLEWFTVSSTRVHSIALHLMLVFESNYVNTLSLKIFLSLNHTNTLVLFSVCGSCLRILQIRWSAAKPSLCFTKLSNFLTEAIHFAIRHNSSICLLRCQLQSHLFY